MRKKKGGLAIVVTPIRPAVAVNIGIGADPNPITACNELIDLATRLVDSSASYRVAFSLHCALSAFSVA
jgi:hypothetical protein